MSDGMEWEIIRDDAKKALQARKPKPANMSSVVQSGAPHRKAGQKKTRSVFTEGDFSGGRYDNGHVSGSFRF